MPSKSFGVGGLRFVLHAGPTGLGVGLHYSGASWDRFVRYVRSRRGPPPAGAAPPESSGAEAALAPAGDPAQAEALRKVAGVSWYHSFDFGNGVVARGLFDHAPILPHYKLPDSLAGMRVLDVASFDGYWAFEFERRGAREVLALDIEGPADLDWQPRLRAQATPAQLAERFGKGFAVAKDLLGAKAQRVVCNVYDLAPERFGTFDVVHAGDVLIHLKNPVGALQRIASVCTGYALISDVYSPELDLFGAGALVEYKGGHSDITWWRYGLPALRRMVEDAGFARVELVSTFRYGMRGHPPTMHHAVLKAIK